ncbi:MAG: glycosyltransferase family 4 protein [Bacteroidota bacterium]
MRICLITYEYPPDTGIGGIGTYMYQLSKSLEKKKIKTEIICATGKKSYTEEQGDYLSITRINCHSTEEFRKLAPPVAKERFDIKPFDVIECPEFGAEGLHIKEVLPDIPLVIKFHTPKFLIKEINDFYYDQLWWRKLKLKAGFRYNYKHDPEYKATLRADMLIAPSHSIKQIIATRWGIEEKKIIHLPYIYDPSPELLNIQPGSKSKTILYMGRLETRKGVYNLAKAIPLILEKIPDARFIFLGKDSRGPLREKSMKSVLEKEVAAFANSVSFLDHVSLDKIPFYLAQAQVCVFPSLWENFPNVCLEAMSTARNIVASQNGGMRDMLEDISTEQLVNPHDVMALADNIIASLQNNSASDIALQNREKVLQEYGDMVIDKIIQLYQSLL